MRVTAPHRYAPLTQNYDKFLIGGVLTNKRIAHYARLGFYGTRAQQDALQKSVAKPRCNTRKRLTPNDILAELDL